jgi:hypothetical protein
VRKKRIRKTAATTALIAMSMFMSTPWLVATAQAPPKSINSTSQNSFLPPSSLVAEQPQQRLINYQALGANDLGMHCGDFDHREVSILPPFNTLHAQVVKKGPTPQILNQSEVQVVYSAASNPQDPALVNPATSQVFKTNFWDINPRTGHANAFDAYDTHYPPGTLSLFPLQPDIGLPVPDLQRLYLGDHQLAADQQAMPSNPLFVAQPYTANDPQPFKLFYKSFPFFVSFPFGYTQEEINWFSAEGIPVTPFDDLGRSNPFPLMRVQAMAVQNNTLGLTPGTVMASLDTPTPVSGELNCKACHTSADDGGNELATKGKGFTVAKKGDDPQFAKVPEEVSIEYAFDLNILRLHDTNHGTKLETETPVSCQRCHYSPALDLAHVGPKGPANPDANGRTQTTHQSMSRVIHNFHAPLTNPNGTPLFPAMPSPVGRTTATRDTFLARTCYQCHPGQVTKCFRGVMFGAGAACQDCHGNLAQVGNDFSKNVSPTRPGAFVLAADYSTNPATPRVPWANEPGCQSCHTGDVNSNLTASAGVIKAADGIRLLQAYRTSDADAKPIVATNRRFAENVSDTKQVLYRLSKGHGGIFCEGCHGSTHAEWPNPAPAANDNVTPVQLQGFAGKLIDCTVCHGTTPFPISAFRGNFDADGLMKGPHGMHPVNDPNWNRNHKEVFESSRTPRGTCQACHGARLQGSVLARLPVTRTLICDEAPNCRHTPQGKRITLPAGTLISCNLCHERPEGSESLDGSTRSAGGRDDS